MLLSLRELKQPDRAPVRCRRGSGGRGDRACVCEVSPESPVRPSARQSRTSGFQKVYGAPPTGLAHVLTIASPPVSAEAEPQSTRHGSDTVFTLSVLRARRAGPQQALCELLARTCPLVLLSAATPALRMLLASTFGDSPASSLRTATLGGLIATGRTRRTTPRRPHSLPRVSARPPARASSFGSTRTTAAYHFVSSRTKRFDGSGRTIATSSPPCSEPRAPQLSS
jgi:hypothetical protein